MQRFSQTRAQRSTHKRRHRTQRRRRSEKRACCDTIEESSSSAEEADARRLCARFYKESPQCSFIHSQPDTSIHPHIPTFRARDCGAHDTWHHERASVHCSVTRSLQLKLDVSHDLCRQSLVLALLSNLGRGGYTGVRLGEAQNPGPATAQQRIVRGSQDSVTRGVRNMQISDTPATQTARSLSPSTAGDAQLSETSPGAAGTAAPRVSSVCAVWLKSRRHQSSLRPRPHAAHGSETRGTTTASRKRWAAAPSRPCSLCSLWHHQVAAMSLMHLLRR